MKKNIDWVTDAAPEEIAANLELIAKQGTADVNYYVLAEAAKRLRAYAASA